MAAIGDVVLDVRGQDAVHVALACDEHAIGALGAAGGAAFFGSCSDYQNADIMGGWNLRL